MTVTIYKSTDAGAPTLVGLGGSFVALLDAILVNGYGAKPSLGWTKAFASLVCSGTATGGANNKLIDTATDFVTAGVVVGMQVFRTADGKSARVSSISTTTNANDTLNFTAVAAIGGYIGTPTFANLDAYTVDSNLRAYRQPAGTNQFYMRVDDQGISGANYSRWLGYETMSDIDTGTGGFPTAAQLAGGLWAMKAGSAANTNISWYCISNGKIFYLIVNQDAGATWVNATTIAFGDFISTQSGDAYNTIAIGGTAAARDSNYFLPLLTVYNIVTAGHYVARSYTQSGTSMTVGKHTNSMGSATTIGGTGITYPNPEDSMLYISPVFIHEGTGATGSLRGYLPGIWCPLHAKPLAIGDTYTGVGALTGKTFESWDCYTGAQIHFEISDTW